MKVIFEKKIYIFFDKNIKTNLEHWLEPSSGAQASFSSNFSNFVFVLIARWKLVFLKFAFNFWKMVPWILFLENYFFLIFLKAWTWKKPKSAMLCNTCFGHDTRTTSATRRFHDINCDVKALKVENIRTCKKMSNFFLNQNKNICGTTILFLCLAVKGESYEILPIILVTWCGH